TAGRRSVRNSNFRFLPPTRAVLRCTSVAESRKDTRVNPAPQTTALAPAWPRPAQLAAAFLLGAAAALLGVHLWGGGPPQPLDLRHSTPPSHAIDLNRAETAEIRQLPGIGPTLAARISSARNDPGFRTADELR